MSDKMTRDDLLTLMRAWGWTLCGTGNRGAYERWQKGAYIVRLPLFDDQDTAEWLEGAQHELAKAEGPRLLAVVREVARLHQPYRTECLNPCHETDCEAAQICKTCDHIWPCQTGRAVQALTETTEETK